MRTSNHQFLSHTSREESQRCYIFAKHPVPESISNPGSLTPKLALLTYLTIIGYYGLSQSETMT